MQSEVFWGAFKLKITFKDSLCEAAGTGQLYLLTGTGWRAFFQIIFGPPGPYDVKRILSSLLKGLRKTLDLFKVLNSLKSCLGCDGSTLVLLRLCLVYLGILAVAGNPQIDHLSKGTLKNPKRRFLLIFVEPPFWKSKFLYRYRPEGIFRIFSA